MQIVEPGAELVWITPNAIEVIEAAGRICYRSEGNAAPGSAPAFVRQLLRRGHESVIEHAAASFRIVCDRGVSHEIVRHRVASYSQESTRYCNYSHDRFGREIAVIEPPGLAPSARRAWEEGIRAAETAYFSLLSEGEKPQAARAVLPTCLKTELYMTANFREWRHFLRMRMASDAHPQIIPIARRIRDILVREAPAAFEDL